MTKVEEYFEQLSSRREYWGVKLEELMKQGTPETSPIYTLVSDRASTADAQYWAVVELMRLIAYEERSRALTGEIEECGYCDNKLTTKNSEGEYARICKKRLQCADFTPKKAEHANQ